MIISEREKKCALIFWKGEAFYPNVLRIMLAFVCLRVFKNQTYVSCLKDQCIQSGGFFK